MRVLVILIALLLSVGSMSAQLIEFYDKDSKEYQQFQSILAGKIPESKLLDMPSGLTQSFLEHGGKFKDRNVFRRAAEIAFGSGKFITRAFYDEVMKADLDDPMEGVMLYNAFQKQDPSIKAELKERLGMLMESQPAMKKLSDADLLHIRRAEFANVDFSSMPPVWDTGSARFTLDDVNRIGALGYQTIIDSYGNLRITPKASMDQVQLSGDVKLKDDPKGGLVLTSGRITMGEGIRAEIPKKACSDCAIRINDLGQVQVTGSNFPLFRPGKPGFQAGTLRPFTETIGVEEDGMKVRRVMKSPSSAILRPDYIELVSRSEFENALGATFRVQKNTAYFDDKEKFEPYSTTGKSAILSTETFDPGSRTLFAGLVVSASKDNRIDVSYDRERMHYSRVDLRPGGGIVDIVEQEKGRIVSRLGVQGDRPFVDVKYGVPSSYVRVLGSSREDDQYLFSIGGGKYAFGRCVPPACKDPELLTLALHEALDKRLGIVDLSQVGGSKQLALEDAGISMTAKSLELSDILQERARRLLEDSRSLPPFGDESIAKSYSYRRVFEIYKNQMRDLLADPNSGSALADIAGELLNLVPETEKNPGDPFDMLVNDGVFFAEEYLRYATESLEQQGRIEDLHAVEYAILAQYGGMDPGIISAKRRMARDLVETMTQLAVARDDQASKLRQVPGIGFVIARQEYIFSRVPEYKTEYKTVRHLEDSGKIPQMFVAVRAARSEFYEIAEGDPKLQREYEVFFGKPWEEE
ncbi:hypothetical protein HY641_02060 [Candidatus Woesearchaeota archaeon]|nr:hypothetical protein [Candidatus Woesearchaeota archaeon]